jgi:gamma-glutamylcyclotransferase (GGCT)/AIG2-like uncharacterized protein YtfP
MKMNEIILEAGAQPIYYFAYGMLTDPGIMQDAKFIGRGQLQNFKFEFYKFADVVQSGGEHVDGVLWELPDEQMLRYLDHIESYPNMYGRKIVPIFVNGQKYEAWVYYMTPDTRQWAAKDRKPSESYVKTIMSGYKHAGIATNQVDDAYQEIA